jgi:hypothetical protein
VAARGEQRRRGDGGSSPPVVTPERLRVPMCLPWLCDLGMQLIGAIVVAREGGVGNGGPQPWACRLRRVDGSSALVSYPTSISNTRLTQSNGEK